MRTNIFVTCLTICFSLVSASEEAEKVLNATPQSTETTPLTQGQIQSLSNKSPKESAAFLVQQANDRSGNLYAKQLVIAAGLIERIHQPVSDQQVATLVYKWVNENMPDTVESKLLDLFYPSEVQAEQKLVNIKSLMEKFDSESEKSIFKLYSAIVTCNQGEATIADFFELKEIQHLVSAGNLEAAQQKIEKIDPKGMSPEFSEFFSSLRLTIELLRDDPKLFGLE